MWFSRSIKTRLRDALILAVYLSGLSKLRRSYLQRRNTYLIRVLCFHRVNALDAFGEKMRLLKEKFNIVALRDIFDADKLLRSRTNIAITFDDGFVDLIDSVLPILRELHIPATVFLPSGCIGLSSEEAKHFYRECMHVEVDRALTRREVGELAQEPLIEIGSHSRTHRDLGCLKDEQALREETVGSRRDLEEISGSSVISFAYPFGDVFNYSPAAIEVLRQENFSSAFTIVPGFNYVSSDRYQLHRDSLPPDMSNLLFYAWLDGSYDVVKAWVNRRKISQYRRSS
jgi:peptidoglycan/xylan/chitin deacetylase (PgdA/CDA1 family)